MQIKIKKYLKSAYSDNGVKYVLLGGDCSIIPPFYAFCKVGKDPYSGDDFYDIVPSDIFYSCFGGSFDWNADSNDIKGDSLDDVNFTPSVYVTRALVSTVDEAEIFVSKTIDYEKNPKWNNTMLMAGVKLWEIFPNGKSDVDVQGYLLHARAIYPYWSGDTYRLYDTSTSFDGGASYNVSPSNFQAQLSKGYSFIDMNTHGYPNYWTMESPNSYYSTHAANLQSQHNSIIITAACYTNAYDKSNCLSRAFLNNSNCGVIAYWGSSRYGWGNRSKTDYGASLKFEENFYKKLFDNDNENYSFGQISAIAKMRRISYANENDADRWLMFSINPIGDPEMPILVKKPETFSKLICLTDKYAYHLKTRESGCQITIMSKEDFGKSYYKIYRNVSSLDFNLPTDCYVCVTKNNFVPYVQEYEKKEGIIWPGPYELKIVSVSPSPASHNTTVTISNDAEMQNLKLVVTGVTDNVEKQFSIEDGETTKSIDLSNIPSGPYIVSLIAEDEIVDTFQIIKN